MIKDFFLILFQPQRTLDRLLFEENHRHSWSATWKLIAISAVGTLLMMLMYSSFFMKVIKQQASANFPDQGLFILILLSIWVVLTAFSVGALILARFVFSWFVILGLRMVAGRQYPQDPEERQHKAKLLQLIHPYTLGMQTIPVLVLSVITLLLFNGSSASLFQPNAVPQFSASLLIGMLVNGFTSLLNLALIIYMIVVRVMAIEKIYGISGARTFWGPFLVYFLVYFIVFVILLAIGLTIGFMLPHSADSFTNSQM